ncbi:MAG: N-acetylmuramoyl-L-alanine amidase [Rhodothermales bacterium]|nr:N-acetylmuramoyl-L-alanine amidase [Rhodothermales bacterium]MBO6780286.1 N-acetylmuramoyl-L-alanine amidase [Rhodothermales bacterium]
MPRLPAVLLLLSALFLTPDAWAQTATPEAGEGIWGLLRRSGITPNAARVEAFKALNAERLKGSDQLVAGVAYQLPGAAGSAPTTSSTETVAQAPKPAPQARRYPIFGPDHEMVVRKSSRLAGHVYYVVAGHGGPDPGSVGRLNGRSMPEDEIAYDTSLRLARRLVEEGGKVYVIVRDSNDGIRDSEYLPPDRDEFFYGNVRMSSNYVTRLRQRRDVINRLYDKNRATAKSQQVISVHVDAMAGRHQPQIDVHFAYSSDSGRSLGRVLQTEMRAQYAAHQPGRGYNGKLIRRDGLMILNKTKPTAVLVELGNIRHTGDQIRLIKPGNRQALAEWITEGLLRQAASTPSRGRSRAAQ